MTAFRRLRWPGGLAASVALHLLAIHFWLARAPMDAGSGGIASGGTTTLRLGAASDARHPAVAATPASDAETAIAETAAIPPPPPADETRPPDVAVAPPPSGPVTPVAEAAAGQAPVRAAIVEPESGAPAVSADTAVSPRSMEPSARQPAAASAAVPGAATPAVSVAPPPAETNRVTTSMVAEVVEAEEENRRSPVSEAHGVEVDSALPTPVDSQPVTQDRTGAAEPFRAEAATPTAATAPAAVPAATPVEAAAPDAATAMPGPPAPPREVVERAMAVIPPPPTVTAETTAPPQPDPPAQSQPEVAPNPPPAPTPAPAPIPTTQPPPQIAAPAADTPSVAAPPAGSAGATDVASGDGRAGEGGSGDAASSGSGANDYAALLRDWLVRHQYYPSRARERGIEGVAVVAFAFDRQGQVLGVTIQSSSGSGMLDDAALAMVERASPLPPPPDGVGGAQIRLTLPVSFSLAN